MLVTDWSKYAPYFRPGEFRCQCGCGKSSMHVDFMDLLLSLRLEYGKPMEVTSGYRCPEHNVAVSSTGPGGPHTTGRAADFHVTRGEAYLVSKLAFAKGFTGIGWNQKGGFLGRFVHLDTLPAYADVPRPTIWTY